MLACQCAVQGGEHGEHCLLEKDSKLQLACSISIKASLCLTLLSCHIV